MNDPRTHQHHQRKPNEYIIEGLSVLTEFLRLKPQAVKQVYCHTKHRARVEAVLSGKRIPLSVVESADRNPLQISKSPVFACVEIHYQSLQNLIVELRKGPKRSLVLALDHITDPRNLGAIARSAAFFGVKYILIPKTRQVLLTEASVASSQGAFAYTELVLVSNLHQALEKLKEENYWVLCADMGGLPYEKATGQYEKCVLLLGSEGEGVSDLLKRKSDLIISIPPSETILDSLNVSVAAGILLNAFSKS